MTMRTMLRDLSFSTGEKILPKSVKTKGWMGSLRRAASDWARDAYVLSYPKSGRTWLRTMMGHMILRQYGVETDNPMEIQHFWKISSKIPNIGFTHDDYPNLKFGSEVETDKSRYSGKKIVLLTRDPRDVVVSYYFDAKNRMKVIDCDMEHYLRHERGSIDAVVAFYNAWARNRTGPRGFHWITYEDMHADAAGVLRSTAGFLGIPEPGDKLLQDAVQFGSFDNMRKTELKDGFKHERLRPADPDNPDSFKVRRGKAGGFVDYFSKETIEYIDNYIDENLDPFFARYKRKTDMSAKAEQTPSRDSASD
ncbi:hypothetical protein FHS61_000623 [Altererythrobacter atlanticus]|uniref:Sulfotransferase domain protein n=1 Tax=Croceibacterium atlanticum TaxID=1267766 RepID=A0A0F7KVP7_9SPHN|nr:sulfotransferase domain-containing protein [Croceibacterium atlanticum]AKH42850.1 Sulfotransferase domain protein [Croceibacterium atlanticum]MBB5731630.1 hypothetical protein [Croceibacterium atlanticum]